MVIRNDNRICHKYSLAIRAINSLLLCIGAFLCLQSFAQADTQNLTVQADGVQILEDLSPFIYAYRDPRGALTVHDILESKLDDFSPLTTPSPNFGFTDDKIWLRFDVRNTTEKLDKWYIHVQENFLQNYEVYLQRANGEIELLERHTPQSRFTEREIAFPELVTPAHIAPGETITFFMSYSSGGSTNISLSLQTENSFLARSISQTSKNFISYGMIAILIVTAFLAVIILQMRVFFSYFLYVVVTLLFLMHSDGVTFKYLWPDHPTFNSNFSIIIGLALALMPYDFARVFLRTKIFHPKTDKFMLFMLVFIPIIVIPLAFIDAQKAKQLLMLLVFVGICAGIFAGLLASIKRFREVRFYVLAWIFGGLCAGIMNLRHFTSADISQNIELDSIRIAIVVDAVMMGLGVADRYLQNLKASRALDKKSLIQAQQNLRLNERLFDLEEQYKLATELVETRDVQLKNTVHDLRQPLHALRLNVKKLQNESQENAVNKGDLDETFTYLETLIADHLQSSVREGPRIKANEITQGNALNLPQILKSIYEMFFSDAQSKGLDFRLVKTTRQSDIPPLIIMRIMTNIVSNAIKYTAKGKIVLGVRRTPNAIRIEVHDTGAGLTQAQFNTAILRGTRLSKDDDSIKNENSGSGLGLNIANTLARQNGLKLIRLSGRHNGTSIALVIPHLPAEQTQKEVKNRGFT